MCIMGIYGICKKNKCLLIIYSIGISILMLIFLGIGIAILVVINPFVSDIESNSDCNSGSKG